MLLASLWWHPVTAVLWGDIAVLCFLVTYSELHMCLISRRCYLLENRRQRADIYYYNATFKSNDKTRQCLHLMLACIINGTVSFLRSVHDFSHYGILTTSEPDLMLLIISWMTLGKSLNLFELHFPYIRIRHRNSTSPSASPLLVFVLSLSVSFSLSNE